VIWLAIDPGPELSAYVYYDVESGLPLKWAKVPNTLMMDEISWPTTQPDRMVYEMIASYGMSVGKEVFETCVWIGRFIECWKAMGYDAPHRRYRRDVKLHLCSSMKAKDTNVRQALIDRYGPGKDKAVGRKATPGPLYGMKADCWQALGVAITAAETGS
jgi:hypothetical protein